MATESMTVARYIVHRLAELGVGHLFQVPGNYTAEFLLEAERSGKIKCIGTTNEMEAGYAADAYARLHGVGAVSTTYGVGSFSLLNAIAGARVERCPVVLINGGPSRAKSDDLEQRGVLFAHAIDTIRTDERIFRGLTAASAVIVDPEDAPKQIDRVLRACVEKKMPVYLESRDGIWNLSCSAPSDPLIQPPQGDTPITKPVEAAVKATLQKLQASSKRVLWGGEELQRFKLEPLFEELIQVTEYPYTTTLMGKSLVPETDGKELKRRPKFIGVYDSGFAPDDVKKVLAEADCVLALGTILSDFYGQIVQSTDKSDSMVLAAANAVRVGPALYPNVPLKDYVKALVTALKQSKVDGSALQAEVDKLPEAKFRAMLSKAAPTGRSMTESVEEASPGLSWKEAFDQLQSVITPDTYVLADTSLVLFPAAELLISSANHFIAQTAWLSIGYTVGAAVGVASALKPGERVLVLVGDGGFQMGPQGLATLAKLNAPVTVVVFDNALYGVEQFLVVTQIAKDELDFYEEDSKRPGIFFNRLAIHDTAGMPPEERWDYVSLAKAFRCGGANATTPEELAEKLQTAASAKKPTLIAVRIDPRSVPLELEQFVRPRMKAAGRAAGRTAPPAAPPMALFN